MFFPVILIVNKIILKCTFTIASIQTGIIIILYYILSNSLLIIGITGQFCAGKSTAIKYLSKKYNIVVLDINKIKQDILSRKNVFHEIVREFGNDILIENKSKIKTINKNKLQSIIMRNPNKKEAYERILYYRIILSIFTAIIKEKLIKRNENVFIENAYLLKSKLLRSLCSSIISICISDEQLLMKRIITREKCTEEQAKRIINHQTSLHQYKVQSDIFIKNEKDKQYLFSKLDTLIKLQ